MRKMLKRIKRVAARGRFYQWLKRVQRVVSPPAELDYARIMRTGHVPLPVSFTFEPTLKCNLRCRMCYQNKYRDEGVKPELSFEAISKIIKSFDGHFRNAYLVGGEVFLRRDFEDMLDLMEKEKIDVFFTTNGVVGRLERIARLKKYANLVGLWFSIDGIGEVHDRIRGPHSFERTVKSLQEAQKHFEVGASFVIMQDNLDHMLAYAEFVADMGVIEVNFQHEIFSTSEEVAETQTILGWKADELMVSARSGLLANDFLDRLRKNLAMLEQLERRKRIVVSFEPSVANQRLDEFYGGTLRRQAHLFCQETTNLRIDPQGNVIFCPYLRRSFGNLLENPVESIWNSMAMRQFRIQLLENNLFPICQRCCKLGLRPDDGTEIGAGHSGSRASLIQIESARNGSNN